MELMYFMSNFTRRKAQACATHVREKNMVLCTKLKWFILTNFNFVKSLPTRCTSHSSGNLQSSMTGWVIFMTLLQDDALNKIKKHFSSKKRQMTNLQGNIKSKQGRSLADHGNHLFNLWLFIRVKWSTFKPNLIFAWLCWQFSCHDWINPLVLAEVFPPL